MGGIEASDQGGGLEQRLSTWSSKVSEVRWEHNTRINYDCLQLIEAVSQALGDAAVKISSGALPAPTMDGLHQAIHVAMTNGPESDPWGVLELVGSIFSEVSTAKNAARAAHAAEAGPSPSMRSHFARISAPAAPVSRGFHASTSSPQVRMGLSPFGS